VKSSFASWTDGTFHAKRFRVFTRVARAVALVAALLFAACAKDTVHKMVVSIPDQKMAVYKHGQLLQVFDVSTSRFCVSSRPGTNGTPLGKHEIARKIGEGQPSGMKFSSRRPTGEIVRVNAPGRDPIVSRILWLKGLEPQNRTSFSRTIYIHGTPEEWRIGRPASFGCVRMRSKDVIDLFNTVGVGAAVDIVNRPLDLPPDPNAAVAVVVPAAGPQVAQAKKAVPHTGL
jgi:lipoprotein-anchoring transpeptidase ErfK/SrfK